MKKIIGLFSGACLIVVIMTNLSISFETATNTNLRSIMNIAVADGELKGCYNDPNWDWNWGWCYQTGGINDCRVSDWTNCAGAVN